MIELLQSYIERKFEQWCIKGGVKDVKMYVNKDTVGNDSLKKKWCSVKNLIQNDKIYMHILIISFVMIKQLNTVALKWPWWGCILLSHLNQVFHVGGSIGTVIAALHIESRHPQPWVLI